MRLVEALVRNKYNRLSQRNYEGLDKILSFLVGIGKINNEEKWEVLNNAFAPEPRQRLKGLLEWLFQDDSRKNNLFHQLGLINLVKLNNYEKRIETISKSIEDKEKKSLE